MTEFTDIHARRDFEDPPIWHADQTWYKGQICAYGIQSHRYLAMDDIPPARGFPVKDNPPPPEDDRWRIIILDVKAHQIEILTECVLTLTKTVENILETAHFAFPMREKVVDELGEIETKLEEMVK